MNKPHLLMRRDDCVISSTNEFKSLQWAVEQDSNADLRVGQGVIIIIYYQYIINQQ